MASDNEASCESDPNFAVICAFMEKFGTTCGLQSIDFLELQEMLENTQEVPQELIDLHIKLLRKSRKTVSNERWEKAIIKFCHSFCSQDAWEIERFGYKKARLSSKLRVLKELLEMQFDYNARFKAEINKMSAEELRSQPLGKDKQGHAYWFQNDNNCQIRVYKEDPDEETWTLVAKDREGLASLISELSDGDSKISSESAINEDDSNSFAEKPIIDTGQIDSSSDSNKKLSGDSDNSNESKDSNIKKEENISFQEEGDTMSGEEMTNKRRRKSDDENGNEAKKIKSDIQVSEAIEEPIMVINGEGNGKENECINPIVGEEIEEDLMMIYGEGNGRDCETGNEDKTETTQNKNQSESVNESSKSVNRDASNSGLVSISDSKNCVNDEVPTSPVKSSYKLGTIIDTKTDNKFFSTVKSKSTKKSRWDVDTVTTEDSTGHVKELVTKWEQKESDIPKKPMFFFGPGCLQYNPATVGFGQKVPPEKTESLKVLPDKEKGDVGYRIDGGNKIEANDCVQNCVETPVENRLKESNISLVKESEQTKVAKAESCIEKQVLESIEKEIITTTNENQSDCIDAKLPEVTAELIGCKDEIQDSVSVPVIDEICIKKNAYILGEEKPIENHQNEIESETVIKKNEDVDNVELNKISSLSMDENENKQVISNKKQLEVTTDITVDTLEMTKKSDETSKSKQEIEIDNLKINKTSEINETAQVTVFNETFYSKNNEEVVLEKPTLEALENKKVEVIKEESTKTDISEKIDEGGYIEKTDLTATETIIDAKPEDVRIEESETKHVDVTSKIVPEQIAEVASTHIDVTVECDSSDHQTIPEKVCSETALDEVVLVNLESDNKDELLNVETRLESDLVEAKSEIVTTEPKMDGNLTEARSEDDSELVRSKVNSPEDKLQSGSADVAPNANLIDVRPKPDLEEHQPLVDSTEVTDPVEVRSKVHSVEGRSTVDSVEEKATVDSVEVRSIVDSVEGRSTVDSVEISSTVDSVEISSTVDSVEEKATVDSVAVRSTDDSVEVRPTVDSVAVRSTDDSVEVRPIDDSVEVRPTVASVAVSSTDYSVEVRPTDDSVEVKPTVDSAHVPDACLTEQTPVSDLAEVELAVDLSKIEPDSDSVEDKPKTDSDKIESATDTIADGEANLTDFKPDADSAELKSETDLSKVTLIPATDSADTISTQPESSSSAVDLSKVTPETDATKPQVEAAQEIECNLPTKQISSESTGEILDVESENKLVSSDEIKIQDNTTDVKVVPEKLAPEVVLETKSESDLEDVKTENIAVVLPEKEQVAVGKEIEDKIVLSSLEQKPEVKLDMKLDEELIEAEDKTKKEPIVYLKSEDKVKVNKDEVKETLKRSRKNNLEAIEDEKKPRIATRRSLRSSKSEEIIIEEKPVEPATVQQARRGRSRLNQKASKDENVEDNSKKMKLSQEDSLEDSTVLKSKQTDQDETSEKIAEPDEKEETQKVKEEETVVVESSSSNDVVEVGEKDPLAVSEEESKEAKPMSLANFSLDFNDSPTVTPPITRSGLRKRGRESPQNLEETEETVVGKRPKMKAKRAVDVKLRKSIEEQKKKELISSDDDSKNEEDKSDKKKHKKTEEAKSEEDKQAGNDAEKESSAKKSKKNKNKRLLSNLGIDPDKVSVDFDQQPVIGVRQSRRIAQLKIKEEAERRKLEEETLQETQKKKKSKKNEDKDYKVEKKKLKNDDNEEEAEEDSNDSKKRKKKKKKKHKLFDELNPWRSSSDSSSSNEEEEMAEEEEEEDEDVLQYVSDHEFSPESDLEGDGEAQPLKRARTARKESDVEEVDDCPCQKCGKSDHPEWILLCDSCDNGWHCSCLRPPLLVIPEGDWFCPPCQHSSLLQNLSEKLTEYDRKLNKKEIEDRRKQRLAYVGISLNSVLPTKDTENIKRRRISVKNDEDDDDDDDEDDRRNDDDAEIDEDASSEESESESGTASEEDASDSDEPIYQLRQRRQAHSYRFNDYDELINSAIQDEMEAVKGAGNQGRGKDIATIVNAEKEEERKKELEATQVEGEEVEPQPPEPVDEKVKEDKQVYEVEEPITIKKKIIGRKKHRKLNALDISSGDDDEDSDEDFKGTSSESDDDFDEELGSEDSDDLDSGKHRRRGGDPIRRSTRARTSRYDADFIDDGESESDDEAPRRKKKRSIWDESESEESDRSWGRRKRKPVNRTKKSTPSTTSTSKKKKSKKKKKQQDSDEEVYKKKKPKIKFGFEGGGGDDEGPVRRTRGKKINYIDALGSDSDDDRGKKPTPRIESDEDFVANEDEKASEEEIDSGGENLKAPKIQIQSYTDARFTQLLPEPKLLHDENDDLNPIDQINRNVEMMDENEMEKMMEDEEYANKHLQMVAMQLEKEKRRKEREAKKMEELLQQPSSVALQQDKKRARKKDDFQFSSSMQEPLVGNVDNLIINPENNDELSEPPGVSLPLFSELGVGGDGLEDSKKRKTKKSLEEAVANLGSVRQQDSSSFAPLSNKMHPTELQAQAESNIEIATPPQPFSQSQPTPSVITRMLQNKPGQPGYPVGTIRPKQFASITEREEENGVVTSPVHPGQYYIPGAAATRPQLSPAYRQIPPLNHYPHRTGPPPQIRNPVPHIYHSHRPLDPSPSGGGPINISDSSPGRVVSPAASSPGSNKNDTPPPPYSRPTPPVARFPIISTTSTGARHIAPPHLQPTRPNLSPYHPGMPPQYHYGQFGQEDALPPTVYQSSPYPESFDGGVNPVENSNSKSFEDESGGEFGGLVSYFSSQREDDLES